MAKIGVINGEKIWVITAKTGVYKGQQAPHNF